MIGLTICGANCLLSADYKSASKIIARTGQSKPGKGDVIVSTRSGGVGSCTVQFKSVMVVPGRVTSIYNFTEIVFLSSLAIHGLWYSSGRMTSSAWLFSHF